MSFHFFDVTRRRLLEDYHPLTVRILARATAIGATPPTNSANFDTYIRSMADVLLNYCDVFFRFRGTGDANFKRINLANPEGVLADFYGGYTLDNSGFKGNGINAYVDTNFNPSLLVTGQKYQLNDASRGIVMPEVTNVIIDGVLGVNSNSFLVQSTNNHNINSSANTLSSAFDLTGTGYKCINRTSSTDVVLVNKEIEGARIRASNSLVNANQLILRRNSLFSDGKASSYFMGKSIPFAVSQSIRSAENADMANLGLPQIA